MERRDIFEYVKEQYGVDPEYPWDDWNAVFRHPGNNKWFALVMEVKRSKLGLPDDSVIDIVNVKSDPITIEIEPELIRIISFLGIDRSIPTRVIEAGQRFSSRYYRNKRLGEFLKELELSEGKSTGVPAIQEELQKNGSPRAVFMTDDDRRAVTVEIPIHPAF